eukprot:4823335-Amphidinium_carterae.1
MIVCRAFRRSGWLTACLVNPVHDFEAVSSHHKMSNHSNWSLSRYFQHARHCPSLRHSDWAQRDIRFGCAMSHAKATEA